MSAKQSPKEPHCTDRVIQLATSVLCNNPGPMFLRDLRTELSREFDITDDDFLNIVKCPRFLIIGKEGRTVKDCIVIAQTSLRVCRSQNKCSNCKELHLCRYFVYGNCNPTRGGCKYSHDVHSEHNYPILKECTLHKLSEKELCLLLLQNDHMLLPEVCGKYNIGCDIDRCRKVHICTAFLNGTCTSAKCMYWHTIDQQHSGRMLMDRGMGEDMFEVLPFIYINRHLLKQTTAPPLSHSFKTGDLIPNPSLNHNEICIFFLGKECLFKDQCVQMHFHRPYKWEVFEGSCWKDMEDMEEIEQAYCDPCNTHSPGAQPVDFLTMTSESNPVRRLSTLSSVEKPRLKLTTEWVWYYKGENQSWIEYGQLEENRRRTCFSSRDLEVAYLADSSAEITVMKGRRHYYLSFQDMYQRNPKHNTKRRVRRRPRFQSIRDVAEAVTYLNRYY